MKSVLTQRLPILLATGAAVAALATGTASAAPEPTATQIDVSIGCSDLFGIVSRSLNAGSGALYWSFVTSLVCLETGSKGTTVV
ncbi:hypothetical protein [Nocardia tengchongensis]|uniref:hypothetical protein n=1 Tax=Nocardia tengchongensis TaxID=2055889 RepID=UPI0036B7C0E2